ncbi:MaoC/PaaZ C-terminal domain-containing protein [Hydrogenophaga sp. BPS33]|uniref:MaoC/PaaZ C-terminal domain-containing protein n=1 Tax=Hydrogenophaga sp. BPS33 TaxID=2651974 RepID=UPI00131FDC7B|nr:MaoC/PaaZ C-terminal domain-containing protein [Hydrogenophaga sp. BPS33]QHE83704.1 3-alpha,7-alpha,12-alpha-trihydroxy-5-beta-cholest-24-enoyl-CoA hydratase [Hydrogenophaga sp. BPS33]
MPIDYAHLKQRPFAPVRQTLSADQCILYALALGAGEDAVSEGALAFTFEGHAGGLRVLPTQAVVLGHPGLWIREPDVELDWKNVLHGEQRLRVHRPLPVDGVVVGSNRVARLSDKGAGKGAVMVMERQLSDEHGTLLATLEQVNFCRGDGGYALARGGQPSDEPLVALTPTPEGRGPDAVFRQTIRPDAALLYRLLADKNPLHVDPAVARSVGFERPILHGLASYGMACRAVLRHFAGDDPARLVEFDTRFSAVVYPGDTLQVEMWHDEGAEPGRVRFRALAVERNQVVLSHGQALLNGR